MLVPSSALGDGLEEVEPAVCAGDRCMRGTIETLEISAVLRLPKWVDIILDENASMIEGGGSDRRVARYARKKRKFRSKLCSC